MSPLQQPPSATTDAGQTVSSSSLVLASPPSPVTSTAAPWFAFPTMADVNVDKMRKLGFRMAMVASHPVPLLGFFQNAPLTIQQTVAKISLASVACFMFSYMISVFLKTPLRFHPPSFHVIMLFFVVGVVSGVCLAFYFPTFMAAATSLLTCLFIEEC